MRSSIALKRRSARTTRRLSCAAAALLAAVVWHGAAAGPPTNELAGAASPYLALHAADPVGWQRWDEDAFAQAARAGKLLLVSSGYFSCHWCHVMQRESFRDARIAALINRHFIPVKIDRETAPALDAALLDFARRTRGQAGWPLQVFVTPAGYPLAAATYQPPPAFAALLEDLAARWRRDAAALGATARAASEQAQPAPAAQPPRPGVFAAALRAAAMQQADELQGGFGAQSRFPHAPQLLALLELYRRDRDETLAAFLRLTLRQMATQGLHDELNGGFFRYTTDPDWQTPHFEKLLTDNALLARVYLRAAAVLDDPGWLAVATETLDFILRRLAAPDGGYYIALSALDTQGVDGGAYLWSTAELRAAAGPHWPLLQRYWELDRAAPFAAGHLPIARLSRAQLAAESGRPPAAVNAALNALYVELRQRRAPRTLPDRQVLAGANGLLLTALAEAVAGSGASAARDRYARAATQLAELLRTRFVEQGRLVRAPAVAATLEDYAYVTEGLARWYAVRGSLPEHRPSVQALLREAWGRFYRAGDWRLGEDALLRWGGTRLALADTAQPAPPALLLRLTRELEVESVPHDAALERAWPAVRAQPFRHASWLPLYR